MHWRMVELLRRVAGEIEKQMHPFCTHNNITPLQMGILTILHKDGPQSITMLAKRTCMANANNSALCKKLEKDGWVVRRRSAPDERQVLVSLTPSGKSLVKAFSSLCEQHAQRNFQSLSVAEVETVVAGLETLLHALEDNKEEHAV